MFKVGDFIVTTNAYSEIIKEPLYGLVVSAGTRLIWVEWINPPPPHEFHGYKPNESISYTVATAIKYFHNVDNVPDR
jgi:hypothetical protein